MSASRRRPTWPRSRARADVVAQLGTARLGAAPETIVVDGRTHLRWRLGDGPSRVLRARPPRHGLAAGLAGHASVRVEDGVLRGPGCFDMKTGLVMAFHAIAACLIRRRDAAGHRRRGARLADLARADRGRGRGLSAALVLEASADGGALKTERKGVSLYEVRITGRASHAGLEPELGRERHRRGRPPDPRGHRAGRPEAGTTVTPTALVSGTTRNTVPAAASFPSTSARAPSPSRTASTRRCAHCARAAGATLEVIGGPNRPPLERKMADALYERALPARRTARPATTRVRSRSAAPRTATSPPASAPRPSTASAPSAAARTPTTSTSWSTSSPRRTTAARRADRATCSGRR